MLGEWRASTWGNEISLEYGKALRGHETARGPYRVFGSNGPIGWTAEPLAPGPGVILGRKGAYRGVQFSRDPFFVIDTAYFVVPKSELDMRWLYYAIKHYKLGEVDDGSPIPSTTRAAVYMLDLDVPPLPEQRAIAHILGTMDDKIELNRRMNETLEAMTRAIFKSWFVDFNPVRAKAEGRDAGLPKPIADLFPDAFERSELGDVPRGWKVRKLSDLCSTQYGYTASAVDGPIGPKLLRVTDINKRNWIEWSDVPHCAVEPKARESYALAIGDLVVARMADPGKSAIIEDAVDAVFASYLVRLRATSLANSYYVYGFLKSDLYAEYAAGARSGSVQANMNARVIVGASLVVPPPPLVEQFVRAILPLRQRLAASVRESRTLASLRDALLPRLVSGALRVAGI